MELIYVKFVDLGMTSYISPGPLFLKFYAQYKTW